jgi:hypothetical protein
VTLRATSRSQRWPKLRDAVLYRGQPCRIVATQVAPIKGFVLRPDSTNDASADLVLPFSEWQGFRWDVTTERWRVA